MQEKMESFIAATGTKSLSGVSDPRSFVEVVIQTYRKYRFLVDEAFKGDMAFEQSLDRACRRFINRSVGGDGSSLAPELVARYSDQLLKKTGEKQEESTREETLNDIVCILIDISISFFHFLTLFFYYYLDDDLQISRRKRCLYDLLWLPSFFPSYQQQLIFGAPRRPYD